MFRWIQGTIWVTGSCILSCPLCVCISGGGAWWVCACTVGLISLTVISGYATWSVFSQLLNENCTNNSFLLRFLTFQTKDNANEAKDAGGGIDCTFLEKEISKTAQAFHSHLVLPWYSHISPDEKYSLQIRTTMEDLLTGILKNIKQHINLSALFKEILIIYLQYYRQFHRALRKVAQKTKKRPVDCVTHEEAILEAYKPIHTALKSKDGIQLHCRRLAHLLLINYLPSDVTRSGLLFICIRDLCAQNLLHAILGQLSDCHWLSETLAASLAKSGRKAKEEKLPGTVFDSCPGEMSVLVKTCTSTQDPTSLKEERVYSYTHSLSSIKEETSFDVIDVENSRVRTRDVSSRANVPKNGNEAILFSHSHMLPSSEHSGSLRKYNQQQPSSLPFPTQEVLDSPFIGRSTAPFDFIQSSSIESDSTDLPSRSVATALGDLISTTAGPLLPDPASFPDLSTKMWKSPFDEEPGTITSETRPLLQKNLFKRAIVEGMTEMDYKELHWKLTKREEVEKEEEKACEDSLKDLLLFPSQKESFQRESYELSKGNQLIVAQGEIQRSKSLNSLPPSKTEVEFDKAVLSDNSKRSVSSEAIPRTSFSLDDICSRDFESSHGRTTTWPKMKGALRKMKSFDRNDATADEFSLALENQTVSSDIASVSQPNTLIKCSSFQKDPKLMEVSLSSSSGSSSTSNLISVPDSGDGKLPSDCLSLELSSLEEEIRGSFGWENPPDLSPIYEESENLASTIAKLRCLLSERQSQHSLGSQSSFGSSESEPKSAQSDPGRYSLEKATRFTFLQKDSFGSLAVKSTSSSEWCPPTGTAEEDLMEASEVALDGKVFVSVSIPTTEVHSEATGFHYTMYLVQYDAIYMCEVRVPSPGEEPRATSEGAPVAATGSAATQHKMMLQTNVVKRRFREFLSLHSALEDDPVMRAAMKGVKGPNKWLNLPFSKLDSATISSRRLFLEKYLQALIQRPQINSCGPLKDFLAYGCDSSISFGKKQLEINVPRLDKFLARKVSGVFHSLKTALPTFDSAETTVQSQVTNSGIAHFHMTSSLSEGGGVHPISDKDPLVPAWATTMLGDFHIRLDITAEEQVCEMENALLAAITASSELGSPVEAALEVTGRDFNSKTSGPQETQFLSPYSIPVLPKKGEAPSTCFSALSNSALPPETGEKAESLCTPCVSSSLTASRTNLPSSIHIPLHVNPLTSFWSEIGLSDVTALPRLRRDSQDSLGVGDGELEDGHPLFDVLVDLLVELVGSSENFLTRRGATVLMSRLFAKPFSTLLESKLDELISEEFLSVAFERIRDCMSQPPATTSTAASYQAHPPHKTEELPCESEISTKEHLKTTLSTLIPNVLEVVLGRETVGDSVTLFVESLQHPVLMRDLGLHLIDLVFVHLLLPV